MTLDYSEYYILLINFTPDDEICDYLKQIRINVFIAENLSEVNFSEIEKSCLIILSYHNNLTILDTFIDFLTKNNQFEKLLIFAKFDDIHLLMDKYSNLDYLIKDPAFCSINFKKVLDKLEICRLRNEKFKLTSSFRKLEEKTELYRTILNSSPEPIIMIDEEGRILGSNDYIDNIMIKKLDSYLGQNIYDLISIGLGSLLRVYTKKAKITQLPVNFLFRHYDYIIEYTIVPIAQPDYSCAFIIFREDQTERDFAERALRFNVDLLSKVLNNLPVMVWHLNHNFVIKLVLGKIENNELFEKIQVGEQVADALEDYPEFYKNILDAAQNRKTYSIETIGNRFIENFYSVSYDSTNKFSGLTIVSNDITEKIQTEIKLEEERRKIRYAFSMSYEWFWEFDYTKNTFYVYKIDERSISDFPPSIMTGEELLQYAYDDEIPYLRKLYISFKKGEIQNIEFFLKLKDYDNNEIWLENKVSVFELNDKTKKPQRLIGVSRNVTDIIKIENEIHKYRNLLESIINSGNIFYLVLDKNMKVVSFNKNAFDVLLSGMNIYLKQDEDFGKFLKDTPLSNKIREAFEKACKGEETTFEHNYEEYIGADFWFEHTFSPIYSLQGEVLYVNIMARPINERKEAERKRQEALLMIENAARIASIGVIAGGITHEIGQPLNAIKIATDGILYWNKQNNMVLPEQITRLITRISNAVTKIEDIIQHMRSYWLDAASSERKEVILANVINRALSLLIQKIQAHEIYLKIEEEKPNLTLVINPLQLEIVINNLLINAIQAIDEKNSNEKNIIIRYGVENNRKYLSISDSGVGLPKGVSKEMLFEPFFSTKKSGKGTGLGLSIVKTFLDRFGAEIDAYNNEMGGATFKIYFNE